MELTVHVFGSKERTREGGISFSTIPVEMCIITTIATKALAV